MSADRLHELRRQRALVQQHLEWLDQEIRQAHADSAIPLGVPIPAPNSPSPAATLTKLPEYEPNPQGAGLEAKRGCLLMTVIAFTLFVATLVGIYFWKYRDRPVLFSTLPSVVESTDGAR